MSFAKEDMYEELNKILGPVEVALGSDLEGLRRKNEMERAELWNRIKTSQTTFENEFLPHLAPDLKREMGSRFCMAKLLLAAKAGFTTIFLPRQKRKDSRRPAAWKP